MVLPLIVSLLLVLASPWLAPVAFQVLARTVGSLLSARSAGRKILLQSLTKEHNGGEAGVSRQAAEDPEWETVERIRTSPNGGKEGDGWSGVIGFFHPFWLVYILKVKSC
jgi:hypothetical protein